MGMSCNCRGNESDAKLFLEGKEIATGRFKLEADGIDGWFLPDSASLRRFALNENAYPLLLADLGTHQHQIVNVRRVVGRGGTPALTAGAFGELIVSQYFEFDLAETESMKEGTADCGSAK
jgi:hypothetical protein